MYISILFRKSLGIKYYKFEKVWVFWVKKNNNLCLSLKNLAKKKTHQLKICYIMKRNNKK
jgi:hypothetical protein